MTSVVRISIISKLVNYVIYIPTEVFINQPMEVYFTIYTSEGTYHHKFVKTTNWEDSAKIRLKVEKNEGLQGITD